MKSEVYSWRAKPELLARLEERAKAEGCSVASLLDRAAREWLDQTDPDLSDDDAQARLHARVRRSAIGTIESGKPDRAARVREGVRARLRRRAG